MTKYYLHYVGSKLYPKEVFIKEAETVGVNRCFPIPLIKNLKWGDKILLGIYHPKEIKQIETQLTIEGKEEKQDRRKNKSNGKAEVFGYYIVTGLNLVASDEFKMKLMAQLNIVKSTEKNQPVNRQCGSYVMGTSYTVTDDISDIIKKAQDLERDFKTEKIKFFVAGIFKKLTLDIEPINFTRALIPVTLETELALEDLEFLKEVGIILNYSKRAYIKTGKKRGRPKK